MKQNIVDEAEPLKLRHIGEEKRRPLEFQRGKHPAAEAHESMCTIPPCSLCAVEIAGECIIIRFPPNDEYVIACLDCAREIGELAKR